MKIPAWSRRDFLAGSAAAVGGVMLGGCERVRDLKKDPMPGAILGANARAGHQLRNTTQRTATETIDTDIVILGGGIAGLAAARRLRLLGHSKILLLELENSVGGNSLSGKNEVSEYPWGAHYLPLPNEESSEVIEFLEALGLITGRDQSGAPIYDEYALCADPMERLFVNGTWQEGVLPRIDLKPTERAELDAFLAEMDRWRDRRGADGKRCFAIPLDRSSSDPQARALDAITMGQYLAEQGWTSEPLRWYVNYCCRDDYGAGIDVVSAWAGIHYFAGRAGRAANASGHHVLTWPAGNGFLVQKMAEGLTDQIRTQHLVTQVVDVSTGVEVSALDLASDIQKQIRAKIAICALPRFIANRVVSNLASSMKETAAIEYSPWMVANLTLTRLPESSSAIAWDNVLRKSASLGYVVATHQTLSPPTKKTVLTYYLPLDDAQPRAARELALKRSHQEWCEEILKDLTQAHPNLSASIERIDIWLWGHAMARPVPGFITGTIRGKMLEPFGKIFFAHSDMSGLSLFEEAYTRGVDAANQVHAHLDPIRL